MKSKFKNLNFGVVLSLKERKLVTGGAYGSNGGGGGGRHYSCHCWGTPGSWTGFYLRPVDAEIAIGMYCRKWGSCSPS